jgi:hypothetical protein
MNPREGGDDYVSDSNNLTFGNEDEPQQEQPQEEQNQEDTPDGEPSSY